MYKILIKKECVSEYGKRKQHSPTAMDEYDKDFSGAILLLYTTKKFIYAVPDGENCLSKMDCSTGEFIEDYNRCAPWLL